MGIIRHSLYWDDFNERAVETVAALQRGESPPVRRVAVFVTDRCNFHCAYCNSRHKGATMEEKTFVRILEKYGNTAIIHITGGEPSVVPWLYDCLVKHGGDFRFHLNTNCYVEPPAESVRRLKVSLDSADAFYWDCLVGKAGAFQRVVENIKKAIPRTVVSITHVLTRENFRKAPTFAAFCSRAFPGLYACFFSAYKGSNPAFAFTLPEVEEFFTIYAPMLRQQLGAESLALFDETLAEKQRVLQGVRFPTNMPGDVCYLSLSERVVSPSGDEYSCSHLYRDGVLRGDARKYPQCLYGCNARLAQFNAVVADRLLVEGSSE